MEGKRYFDEVAPNWDKMREGFFPNSLREKAIRAVNVKPGKLAADIGAGTGFITEELVKKGLKVIAVDQSGRMLREMKKKFNKIDTIDYRKAEAKNIPIETESVDYVFANMFLHHVENPSATIKDMARILKPNGKLVITDVDKHEFEFLKKEHHDRWLGFRREDVRSWFVEAGLKDARIECVGENCCAKSNSGNEYAKTSIFIAIGKK